MPAIPMFPLGTVLFPGAWLPLHVFEPRYRALVHDCLAGTPEFGVVLIERGSEVGGGDVRTDVGTIARIAEARELPDGRWVVGAVGTERCRVTRWLDDDPYPRAEVELWPDPAADDGAAAALPALVPTLRRALALQAELGHPAPPVSVELDDDAGTLGYQVAALAPLGPFDRQRLLAAESPAVRAALLGTMLRDAVLLLEHQLTTG